MYAQALQPCVKFMGLFMVCRFGIFILFFDRQQLINHYVYLSGIITLIIISPIFIWNYNNHFITYNYQGGRVIINTGIQLSSFLREISGEILYCNPIIFILICIILFRTIRNRVYTFNRQLFYLLIFLSLPLIFICWSVSLFRDTLPHWPGPAYISLLILCAFYADECFSQKNIIALLRSANFLVLTIVVLAYFSINYLPLSLGKHDAEHLGTGDFTMDLYGWNSFENAFEKLQKNDIQTHTL